MKDARARILEQQLDAVAGKVKTMQEQMSVVVDVLSRRENEELLRMTSKEVSQLKFPTLATTASHRHASERDTQIEAATREAEITRLIDERRERDQRETRSGQRK